MKQLSRHRKTCSRLRAGRNAAFGYIFSFLGDNLPPPLPPKGDEGTFSRQEKNLDDKLSIALLLPQQRQYSIAARFIIALVLWPQIYDVGAKRLCYLSYPPPPRHFVCLVIISLLCVQASRNIKRNYGRNKQLDNVDPASRLC